MELKYHGADKKWSNSQSLLKNTSTSYEMYPSTLIGSAERQDVNQEEPSDQNFVKKASDEPKDDNKRLPSDQKMYPPIPVLAGYRQKSSYYGSVKNI